MSNRNCPVCGSIIVGRNDKKYCSDQCRYLANNERKVMLDRPILNTNKILRKNRSVLKSLCPAGMATVRRDVMEAMGFDFTVFSSIYVTAKKQVYYLSYDYGFTPLIVKGKKKALIVTKQDYMQQWDPWRYVDKV